MNSRTIRLIYPLVVFLLAGFGAEAAAQSYKKFIGEYEGSGVVDPHGAVQTRDLKVKISDANNGFRVNWISVSRNKGGKTKRKSYTVEFQSSSRDGIYSAAMRTDLFGNRVPLDPLAGDPYVWARIDGDVLFVYAMLINDEGGYEMQVYERTLTATGIDLTYYRVRDGEILRTITAELKRIR
ncbi:MAG TPA: hypothetical protein VIT83_00780 [Gammaproteobacteria bacterium]